MGLVSEENLLGYTEGHKLGHDNTIKSNTFLSYYKGPWYGHQWVEREIPIPPDPPTKPVDPCDLCGEDEYCDNGVCYKIKEDDPDCDDQNPCKAPFKCVNGKCVREDEGEHRTFPKDQQTIVMTDPCDLSNYDPLYSIPVKTNTGVGGSVELANGYTTGVDAYSGERWYYNPLNYHYVEIEGRLNALNNENRLEYGFWNSEGEPGTQGCISIAIAHIDWSDAANGADRFKIQLFSNGDFIILVSRYKEPGVAYDWTVLKQGNVNGIWDASPSGDLDYTLPVGMVVGVMGGAYITSLTTKLTKVVTSTYKAGTSDETTIIHDWTNGTMTFQHPASGREVTIIDKNLGASSYYYRGDAQSDESKGTMYQWGNNYGFIPTGTLPKTSNTKVDTTGYLPSTYINDTYITGYAEWMDPVNKDLWGAITGTEDAKRGPCPKGWHIPSLDEWMDLKRILFVRYNGYDRGVNYWENSFPVWGKYRDVNGGLSGFNENAYYRASDLSGNSSCYINISSLYGIGTSSDGFLGYAMFIRPFKNNVNIPVKYTIRFLNFDGTVLQSSRVVAGSTPEYTGSTPTKPGDQQYVYTFDGWDSPIVAATGNKDYTATYVEKTILYSGNGGQILHNISGQEITLIKTNGEELTIMDRNLGATAYRGESGASAADTYGNLYQWGNNYGFPNSGTVTTSNVQVDASGNSWQNPINSSTFIYGKSNWMNPSNGELWGKTEGTEISRQGPCPNGWHVPSKAEMDRLLSMYQSITGIPSTGGYVKFEQYLLFTYPGYRRNQDGNVASQGQSYNGAHLLTNDINQQLYYGSSWWYYNSYGPACGNPIRPFKNTTT